MKLRLAQINHAVLFTTFFSLLTLTVFFYSTMPDPKRSRRPLLPNTTLSQANTTATDVQTAAVEDRKEKWINLVEDLENQKKIKQLPQVIGIGMEDCGIDDLIQFLLPHPSVRLNPKENSNTFGRFNHVYIENYIKNLPKIEEKAFLLEKKSLGFQLPPYNIPYFIKRFFTQSKLLLMLCEPKKRALENFMHEWISSNKTDAKSPIGQYKDFEEFLDIFIPIVRHEIGDYQREWSDVDAEHKLFDLLDLQKKSRLTSILTNSFYALHLRRWINYFDERSLMVIDSEELYSDPGAVVERVQEFLALPKLLLKSDFSVNFSSGSSCYRSWSDDAETPLCISRNDRTSQRLLNAKTTKSYNDLQSLYESHNEFLFSMLGKRYDW